MLTDTQIREAFHFHFLERLLKTADASIYLLKGGVNLRFFFHSPRYSEDMDLDVVAGGVGTLRKNGYRILEDAAFRRSLRVFDVETIEINDPSKAKHTATTQRFRCALIRGSGQRLPTKVEFSRRSGDPGERAVLDYVDAGIARSYRKLAFPCRHYSGDAAIVQKIAALAGRAVTQARDVFDLGILIRSGHLEAAARNGLLDPIALSAALESLTALDWEDYEGQVVEFLGSESRDEFGSRTAWNALQSGVFEALYSHA